ncbi:hypothetical protein MYP_3274 [Sporocytophaga myxococcoides]|uniref:N-acetyltransferase domain-containing protein n=1 Tax=Sporocytophaga myxococcoides TaxID=153721 RepID=A0A098LGF4_9BACT|nr:hypothetical protein [Sporocytophaga myxococcoides]GAL86045.1 hypothetical protein MYP_3274 [Sporocytophaga myxococcoides]
MQTYVVDNFCRRIDLDHPEDGKEFEKHFYKAFNKLKEQNFLRSIWNWDDEKKTIRFNIPNEHITMYSFRNDKAQSVIYVGGLYDRSYCQFDKFGFQPPMTGEKYGEIITLFSTTDFDGNLYNLERTFLKGYCFEQSREQGCKFLLATCTPQLIRLYLKWNFKIIETRHFNGAIRHLIRFDL